MARPSLTAHALLALIALRPRWSTYELTGQVTRALRFMLPRAESRVYDEARALARRGLVRAENESAGLRPRTVYTLTDEGRAQLGTWLDGPISPTSLHSEALLRVLIGRLTTTGQLLTAVAQMRADADRLVDQGRAVAAEYLAGNAPFQDDVTFRALVFDFLFHQAATMRAWADRAEATISSWNGSPDPSMSDAALSRIRELVTRFPPPATD